MITFRINGEKKKVPTTWNDLTFEQYMKILTIDPNADYITTIAICLNMDEDKLRNAELENVGMLLDVLSFVTSPAKVDPKPERILNYIIPKDIVLESLGQFEDMRRIMAEHTPSADEKDIYKIERVTKAYPKYAAIYCQKIRDFEYDYEKAMQMVPEMYQAPCLEILSAGNFFFVMLSTSFSSTRKTSLQLTPLWKKKRQGLASYLRTLVSRFRLTPSAGK